MTREQRFSTNPLRALFRGWGPRSGPGIRVGSAASPGTSGALGLLLLVSTLGICLSLGLRLAHRGVYYPGWDVLGAAQGLYLVSTHTLGEIWEFYRTHRYSTVTAWNVYGLPIALLPGWLASLWPCEWWPHIVTFVLNLCMLGLIGRALALRGAEWTIVLLAWGASGALLSYSVAGFAYITGFLPYAVALWIVLRLQQHWLWTLVLAALVTELSWHGQELGRTVFVVFLAAGFLLAGVPWKTRGVWLLAGGWQCLNALLHPTFNTARHAELSLSGDLFSRLAALGMRILTGEVDVPILFATGLASALLIRRHRWFWRALLGTHVGLIVALALNDGPTLGVAGVWPRRTLVLLFLCLSLTAAYFKETPRRWVLVGVLLIGNVWQLALTVSWSRQPLDRREADFTLPFTATTLDYMVPFSVVDWERGILDSIEAGKRVVLVYNLSSWQENATNPAAVLERLYLSLGHERFQESVFVFGSQTVRWNTFPVRPLEDLEVFVEELTDPESFLGYHHPHPRDKERFRNEAARIRAAIGDRIEWKEEVDCFAEPLACPDRSAAGASR
jgi:hypothetical protein